GVNSVTVLVGGSGASGWGVVGPRSAESETTGQPHPTHGFSPTEDGSRWDDPPHTRGRPSVESTPLRCRAPPPDHLDRTHGNARQARNRLQPGIARGARWGGAPPGGARWGGAPPGGARW